MKNKLLYQIMEQFEKEYKKNVKDRQDRDEKTMNFKSNSFYKDKMTNELFNAFRRGFYLGKSNLISEATIFLRNS